MNQKNRVINVHNGEKYQKRTDKDQFDIQPELLLIKKIHTLLQTQPRFRCKCHESKMCYFLHETKIFSL